MLSGRGVLLVVIFFRSPHCTHSHSLCSHPLTSMPQVKVGDVVIAEAKVTEEKGKKKLVAVTMRRGEEEVFTGTFTCFVLPKHVLDS